MNMTTLKKRSMVLTLALLMVTLTISATYLAVIPASAQAGSDWPMYRYDLYNTGFNPLSTAPKPFVVGWKFYTGGAIRSQPAIVNGKIYFASEDAYVYCLDANTGALIWKYKMGDGSISSPAVVNNRVYIGSADNYIYCLDANSGSLVWSYKTNFMVFSSPKVFLGRVYINANDKHTYCLNSDTGALIWNFTQAGITSTTVGVTGNYTQYNYMSSPAIVGTTLGNAKVFVGGFDTRMYCLNASTGKQIWVNTSATGPYMECSPAYANGTIVCGNDDTYIYGINATTGSLIWRWRVNATIGKYGRTGTQEASVAIAYAKVWIAYTFDYNTYVVNLKGVTLGWMDTWMGTATKSAPTIADGKLYVGDTDRYLYAYDISAPTSGSGSASSPWLYPRFQSADFIGPIETTASIANGKVYTGANDGWMYCLVAGSPWKIITILTCSAQPTGITLGNPITISGFMRVSHGLGPSNAQMYLLYTKPDGTTFNRTLTTYVNATYQDVYTPDTAGKWTVRAWWPGGEFFEGGGSFNATFTVGAAVTPAATTISCSVSKSSLALGETETVSGKVSPALNGMVTLTYTKPDGTTLTRTSFSQAQDGAYTDTFAPDAVGNWTVTSAFAGVSGMASGSTSSTASFTVSQGATSTTTSAVSGVSVDVVYILAVIAIIAIVAAIVIALMRRK